MGNKDRVLMAVDLHARDRQPIKNLARGIIHFFQSQPFVIEPVFVLQKHAKFLGRQLESEIGDIEHAASSYFSSILRKLEIPNTTEPTILVCNDNSTRKAAMTLADYAIKSKAILVAVNTRSRVGFGRMLLGSFAEAFVQQSTVPLLVLNPQSLFRRPLPDRVLFPTDLSRDSQETLLKYAMQVRQGNRHLILFHQMEPLATIGFDPFMTLPIPWGAVDDERKARRREGEALATEVTNLGITAEFILNESPAPVADSIVTAARRHRAGLIALAARKGPRYGSVLGNITYNVMRKALRPVWVIPEERAAQVPQEKTGT